MRWPLMAMALLVLAVAGWAALPIFDGAELDGPDLPDSMPYDGVVYLKIRDIDLAAQQLTVTASLSMTGLDIGRTGTNAALSVQVGATTSTSHDGVRVDRIAQEFPLDAAYTGTELPSFQVPLTVGSANDYPHDRYAAQLHLEVTVPDTLELPPLKDGSARPGNGRTLVLYVAGISLDNSLRDWTLPESTGPTGSYYDQYAIPPRSVDEIQLDGHAVRFELARGTRLQAYVYSVLAIPLLLVAALVWWRRNGSALEVAAALLAVVTLRQVLVPGDIAGFTLLDKLLGIEIAIIAVAAIWVQSPARRTGD